MYDRDLRTWYRDLFLHPSPRRRGRKRPPSELRAASLAPWNWRADMAETLQGPLELESLTIYEQKNSNY